MTYFIEDVVPLGRSYEEYVDMFALTPPDLSGRILGCADGPASFNAVHAANGGRVVSIDPLYGFSARQIRERIEETFPSAMDRVRSNRSAFVWTRIASANELERIRMKAMDRFLHDYPLGASEGRYVAGELPRLPFPDKAFDLALCSHCLFLYSEQLSAAFHIRAVEELCRVAAEVRIFPLLEFGSVKSRHLDAVLEGLRGRGYRCSMHAVPYEFQRGGDTMLRVQGA